MEIILVILFILMLLVALYFIDAQKNYEAFPYFVYPDGNDKVVFVFKYYIWELNKKEQLKKIFNQSSIVELEGFNYQITHGGFTYNSSNDVFFEKEVRYYGKPLLAQSTVNYNNVIINQYGNGRISLDYSTNVINNEIIEIENYLSEDHIVNIEDIEAIELFLEKVKSNQIIEKEELSMIYKLFMKYEPLASFGLNLLGAIQNFIK
ncbi:hypothetical protein [Peribacillus frigoritolerans]|uniref:hypothetical protein n=1 Tax=Peribacillus frigoritolerans TaxID=450367 RepID=UPI002B2428D6|nr:hypothetical protein [Peribacillus frigoritolerans]